MKKTIIIYGSTLGNTENAAKTIQSVLSEAEVKNISSVTTKEIEAAENIFFGASTWGYGDLQEDWVHKLDEISKLDYSGKNIALFGTGDQESYADTFVDSIGIIYESLKDSKAKFLGSCSTDDYKFDTSKAEHDGKFVGLPLDEDNEPDLTDNRIKNWLESFVGEL